MCCDFEWSHRWSGRRFSHLRGPWLCCDTWIIQQGINHYIVIEVMGETICFLEAVLIIPGVVGPQETAEARWNWSVVTTDWTGNELHQDKWAPTWEMRSLPTKRKGVDWQHPPVLLPSTLSLINALALSQAESGSVNGGVTEYIWEALCDDDKATKQISPNQFVMNFQILPEGLQHSFFQSCIKLNNT